MIGMRANSCNRESRPAAAKRTSAVQNLGILPSAFEAS